MGNKIKPNMTFSEQVDAVLSGADTSSSHLEVLKSTPPLLRMVGVPNLPILMTANHVKTMAKGSGTDLANYHDLGADIIKRLPELISDPVMIMDSISPNDRAKNSIVIVTQTVDKINRPVIGAIRLAGIGNDLNGYEISANILTSAYGKDNFKLFIERNIAQGSVLYVDKEKSQELFETLGIQFPDNFESLSFNTIIRKAKAFVNSKEQENSKNSKNSQDKGHFRALPGELKENTKKNEEENMDIPTTEEDIIANARQRARSLAEETGEPHVTIAWSESAAFESGDVLPLSEADKRLAELDAAHNDIGYDKVKLHIDYVKDGKSDSYEDCRFDIGDEKQGLVSHIKEYWQFYLDNKNWRKRLESQHSADYVRTTYEEYDRMANDLAPFLKRHVELSDMIAKAESMGLTSEEVEEVKSFVRKSRFELNGTALAANNAEEEEHKENIIDRLPAPSAADSTLSAPLSYRDKVSNIRDEMAQTLLDYIAKNPTDWQSGWNNLTAPINGKTNKSYRGFNALYLALIGKSRGYDDQRWVTFSQAKELGASIKKGEKSSPVLFFEFYDRLTKKAYDTRTTKDMTDDERAAYEKENVYAVLKYSSVFNASQCVNFPERDLQSLKMSEEDRANQNELIETIIANSAALVNYDGGNRAYYSSSTDSIHLPSIEAFNSMQDYYATALHEIAHSTGHASRLHRDLTGEYGTANYAIEELRAELACVYMQIEQGIQLEGKHIENHAAYLNSWLGAVKNDKSIFFKAASDAQKIADYVSAHYLQSVRVDELQLEEESFVQADNKDKLDVSIKQWYTEMYPTDEFGLRLTGTFRDLQEAIDNGADVYGAVLGIDDSIARERIFAHLAELQGKSYEEIYDAWANTGTPKEGEHKEESIEEARARARLFAAETGEPFVTFEWSERSKGFPDMQENIVMPLSVADKIFAELDADALSKEITLKANLHIDYVFKGELNSYENLRFYIGSEKGGIVNHIEDFSKNDAAVKAHIISVEEQQELKELTDYFKKHIQYSQDASMSEEMRLRERSVINSALPLLLEKQSDEARLLHYSIDFTLNYSNEMLLSKALKELGYNIDNTLYEKNNSIDTAAMMNREERWTNEIRYLGPNGKSFEGLYGRTFNGILLEATSITGFTTTGMDESDVQAVANIIRDFDVDVDVKELSAKSDINEKTAEQGEHKEELSREERRVHQYADALKKVDTETGFAVRSDEYYLKRAREEIAAYEQSDEYKQAVREDFPKDFIDDTPQDISQSTQKPAQNVPAREWLSIDLPEGSLGNQYGANTMVKMPEGEYARYAIFVPTKFIKTVDGKQKLRVASDFTYRLSNDGRQVELTGQELRDSFAGMQIGKQYKRVAPSRAYAKVYADLEKNVPEEMKALPNWCVYRTWQREDKDKKGKVLKSAVTGAGASSKNPSDWTDFNTAMKYAKENGFAGVAFLLEAKNGITCIDLDECIKNAETGKMKERATKLINNLKGTYMERSTSGNGVHIFIKDDILKGGKFRSTSVDAEKGDLEVYDNQRIISMTGNMFSDTNALTRAGSAATVYLRAELGEQKHHANTTVARPQFFGGVQLSDSELLQWIRGSKMGADFECLCSREGKTGDRSRDDAKLAHILLFFSGGDKEQTFRIIRSTQAYRPDKADSYYIHTIEKMNSTINDYAKRPNPYAAAQRGKDKGSLK